MTVFDFVYQLHNAARRIITHDFMIENKEIELSSMLERLYRKTDISPEEQKQWLADTYMAFYEYLPELASKKGFDVQFMHKIGTLDSTIVFEPAIKKLLMQRVKEV